MILREKHYWIFFLLFCFSLSGNSKDIELTKSIKILEEKIDSVIFVGPLIKEMFSTVESVRKEQTLQLEEVLSIRLQLSSLVDKIEFLENRVSNIEDSVNSLTKNSLDSSQINSRQTNDLNSLKKTIGTGFVLKSMREQEVLRSEVRSLRSAIEEMELKQTQFNSRLRNFYTDIDYRLKEIDVNMEIQTSEEILDKKESIIDETPEVDTSSVDYDNSSFSNVPIKESVEFNEPSNINYIEENNNFKDLGPE